jgi:tRNA-splicing ligase RtcB
VYYGKKNMGMRLKDLSKLGYTDNVARSLAVAVVSKYCKHESKEEILAQLADVLDNPENYKNSDVKIGRTLLSYHYRKKFSSL